MKTYPKIYMITFCLICSFSCKKGPKVISATTSTETSGTPSGIFADKQTKDQPFSDLTAFTTSKQKSGSFTQDLHKVQAVEVLPTEKYVYVRVKEKEQEYWLATGKRSVKVGDTYYYRDGLLKTNFESKEYNRVFDKVILVSKLVEEKHGGNNLTKSPGRTTPSEAVQIDMHGPSGNSVGEDMGFVKISELVNDPSKYEGKRIKVQGKCVKVNHNIMGRNWIHLKDGSKDDFDLVITSQAMIHEGQMVSLAATVGLDRDFGAGYRYDLILENGVQQ